MPFTKKEDRIKVDQILGLNDALNKLRASLKPGDRCFNHYRSLKRAWKKERRWTTADELAKPLFPDEDTRAYFLAYLVFFVLEIMPYEEETLEENGDVE